MIDREKVVLMTKIAREEKNQRRRNFPAVRFFGDDYVCFQVLKGIVGVTLLFLLIFVSCAVYTADVWMTQYSLSELWRIGVLIGILYVCVIVLSSVILFLVYSLKFIRARERTEEIERGLKRLNRYY